MTNIRRQKKYQNKQIFTFLSFRNDFDEYYVKRKDFKNFFYKFLKNLLKHRSFLYILVMRGICYDR